MRWKRPFDLQTKILLILLAVIVPTYLIVTIIQNQLTQPMLEQDLRSLGVSVGEAIANQISGGRMLASPNAPSEIERAILERLYFQPSVVRVAVHEKLPDRNEYRFVASSVDDDPATLPPVEYTEKIQTKLVPLDEGSSYWSILVPIQQLTSNRRAPPKVIGVVHIWVTTRSVARVLERIWQITGAAAVVSIVSLIFLLSYFLRKTLQNERLLRKTEHENVRLLEQLHETQRQMMNTEKLAVMGQLTANFAHEIGTPLNAIGGHLQLLKEDLSGASASSKNLSRLDIVGGELTRIESIVKNFLQTTSKPESQRQLVDLNSLVEKTLGVVIPRIDSLEVDLRQKLDRTMGPIRIVPTDIEQILLNLINNSLDSIALKRETSPTARRQLKVFSEVSRKGGAEWVYVGVYDSGVGIDKGDLKNVFKPFFTTKRPGEGTGLGLAISRQLAAKYGGIIEIDSKEGAWAECRLGIPYRANV